MRHRSSFKDWTGERVGRLLVIKEMPRPKGQCQQLWHVRCDCGNEKFTVHSASLKSGKSTSCGCYRKELAAYVGPSKYQKSRDNPLYSTWAGMRQRCLNSSLAAWKDYGGRGIRICQRWLDSFEDFVDDMGERPIGCSIDRIDVNGGYEPGNCRWATRKQQAQNKRNTVNFDWNGEQLCLCEICRRENVCYEIVRASVRKGIPLKEAVLKTKGYRFKEANDPFIVPRIKLRSAERINSNERIQDALDWCSKRKRLLSKNIPVKN